MLGLEEAVRHILAAVPPPACEESALEEAGGRVLVEEVQSPIDLPRFDNSAMDGYAVLAADVAAAGPVSPVRLRLAGQVAAGEISEVELARGSCLRVFTGSALPRGADAVVMQEESRAEGGREVLFLTRVEPGENVRARGGDVKRGARLIGEGEALTAARIGLLAAVGVAAVRVGRRPVVGLLATGSELRAPGQALAPGQIYESNRLALALLASGAGAVPHTLPLVADALEPTCDALAEAFNRCHVVLTTGGVSVGDMDFVRRAFERMGGALEFWRVAMKPGRPFAFGRYRGKLLFGLPGNPVSAFVTFLLLVRPALLRWQGARDVSLPIHPGVLAEPLINTGERRHFLRVGVDAAGRVWSAGTQASHVLSSMAAANGLVDVPPSSTLAVGAKVAVLRWDCSVEGRLTPGAG